VTTSPQGPRSADEIRAEIERELGVLPPFFAPALATPAVLDALWQHARAAYYRNPIDPALRERLFAYLSRYCRGPFCIVLHTCALRPLGLTPDEIRRLLMRPAPDLAGGADDPADLETLAALRAPLPGWPACGTPEDDAVFGCAVRVFLDGPSAPRCHAELRRALGEERAHWLAVFLGFVHAAFVWVESHPELSPFEAPVVREHLEPLLAEEPALAAVLDRTTAAAVAPEEELARIDEAHLRRELVNLEAAQRALSREVLERRAAERALRESERRLQTIVDGTSAVIYLKDTAGRYQLVNRAFERLAQRPREEVLGRSHGEVFGTVQAEAVAANDRLVLTGDREAEFEEELELAGERHQFLSLKFPLHDADGAVSGLCGISSEITGRKRLEEQLRQSQKMEALGRLAGGIAHDFNNLLTAIHGNSELLLLELDHADPRRAEVEDIHRAAERAGALTRQLLAYSRKQVLQPEVLDLGAVVAGLERMLRRLIGESIVLTYTPAPVPVRVRADRGQLEQVIVNLVLNARDAMPGGGRLTLEVDTTRLSETFPDWPARPRPGNYAQLTVTDTGQGMDAETRTRIFEPFFTTKAAGQGTGLGLATVEGIVKQNEGSIWVYSEPGHGTTFKIYLPRVETHDDALPAPPAPAAPEPAGALGTLLLVEDESAVRQLSAKVLRRHGYRVLEAQHGVEALAVCERHPERIDLVVTDVVMPEMGGGQLVERLRTLRPGIRVLYTSGYADSALVAHGVADEGIPFLPKPFVPAALVAKVREVLETAPQAPPPEKR